ncbi:hypothetical protein IAG44_39195 [Streptomyces roseirectus]|uniref:Uncharacterized protein n=1 Tax=Streptomyces roseirectus TaxID=2768066 RepID=A0A7H0ITM9_9ACTN|nr:hypothetical protein IAG44_39195 [Streptomyces roseirectus]
MGGFVEALRDRVRKARARVVEATREGDVFEKAAAEDELDDALRIARKHGVAVEEEEEGDARGSAV